MRLSRLFAGRHIFLAGTMMGVVFAAPSRAEPAYESLLSTVSVRALAQCAVIDVAFNRPVNYAGHFPPNRGLELMVRLEPLGAEQTPEMRDPRGESASVLSGNAAGLVSATFDAGRANPQLRLTFEHPVRFAISRDTDPRHIIITMRADGDPGDCHSGGSGSDESSGDAASALADGKTALAKKDYSRAVALFTKAVSRGDGAVKRDAQEYLGLARERAGQLAHAEAEYKSYLKTYPKGAGADRVRQRLAGVTAAMDAEAEARFKSQKTDLQAPGKSGAGEGGQDLVNGGTRTSGGKSDLTAPLDEKGWKWEAHGSAGQFYYRDDGFSDIAVLRGTLGDHSVHQNEIVSSGDLTLRGESEGSEVEVRVSGYQENGLDSIWDDSRTSVSTAYVDMKNKASGLSIRAGRQSRSGGGVFGRFDGALASWQVDQNFTLRGVAGSPVYYKSVEPFADGRYFYGASLDMALSDKSLSATLYAIEQDIHDIIDRRAIGAELRYAKRNVTAYGGLDYDIYYGEINSAYISGSWLPTKELTIYGNADYRHVPFLLTSNALIGQSVDSLSDLIDLFGRDATEQLALDRTALAETVMAGASYKLTEDWQVALDATIANYTGTPASGGVDAIPDPGTEYYVSGQISGTNVFTENDYLGIGLRFLDGTSYRTYMADAGLRYPVNDDLRLNPRLRVAYREGKSTDQQQILVMPSLGARYKVADHWVLELEGAARFEDNWSPMGNSQNLELLVTAGYRYEF